MELTAEQIKNLDQIQYLEIEDLTQEKGGALSEERRIIHFISTPHLDRVRDIMNPKGIISTEFDKTKTVFHNHNYDFPIGKNVKLVPINEGVKATTYFSKDAKANDIYNMHLEGVLNNWSIGFRAVRDNTGKIKEGSVIYDEKTGVRKFEEWELHEYSDTGIPCNTNCLDLAKSICKSYELKTHIDHLESILNINNILEQHKAEIAELKSLISQLTDGNTSDIKNEILEINKKLEKFIGAENEKTDTELLRRQIRRALVDSANENLGFKIK